MSANNVAHGILTKGQAGEKRSILLPNKNMKCKKTAFSTAFYSRQGALFFACSPLFNRLFVIHAGKPAYSSKIKIINKVS